MEHNNDCSDNPTPEIQCSVELNKTFIHTITNVSFGELPIELVNEIFKDGRPFSHFIEKWIEKNYPLKHIPGCKKYDFTDINHEETKYDEKTFTKGGCKYCPSNMIGQGRVFNQKEFEEKSKKMVFCIVSNINFPEIKIRFMKGEDLIKIYPKGIINLKDHNKFFD